MKYIRSAATLRTSAHEVSHAVGRFHYGGGIKKLWRAADFSTVPRGEPIGECLYCNGKRKLSDFENIVVGIVGEASDAVLFDYRAAHNFAMPWQLDKQGNLPRGLTGDWIDAALLARKPEN